MASEVHYNVDLVLDVKQLVKMEAEISKRELKFNFFKGQIMYFLYRKKWSILRKGGMSKFKPFLDEILG